MCCQEVHKPSRQIPDTLQEWANAHLDLDVLEDIIPTRPKLDEILQARADYIRYQHYQGILVTQIKGAEFHIDAPFATHTSGWARGLVADGLDQNRLSNMNVVYVEEENWKPYLFNLAMGFWRTRELVIKHELPLKFATSQPTDPKDPDMAKASPFRIAIHMVNFAVVLDDSALFHAALDQIKHRIATGPWDNLKADIIFGLHLTFFPEWQDATWDVALARRILLSALVKLGEVITPGDLRLALPWYSDLYLDYCRGRVYYSLVYGKFGPWAKYQ